MKKEQKQSWVERVEAIIDVLEGSTIGEFELVEGDTEIIIRRQPGLVMSSVPTTQVTVNGTGTIPPLLTQAGNGVKGKKKEQGTPVVAPLTGVYYSAASPSTPPFVNVGDNISVGQVIALVEAMKVFNEITSEVAGRVVALVAKNGDVVQKGDVLLRVEPLS